jgi:hypothetical protein
VADCQQVKPDYDRKHRDPWLRLYHQLNLKVSTVTITSIGGINQIRAGLGAHSGLSAHERQSRRPV